jgi:hypothetical protein
MFRLQTQAKNSDIAVPTVGKLRCLPLLALVESLVTSGYAFLCRKSKFLSPFQLLDKFYMENIY